MFAYVDHLKIIIHPFLAADQLQDILTTVPILFSVVHHKVSSVTIQYLVDRILLVDAFVIVRGHIGMERHVHRNYLLVVYVQVIHIVSLLPVYSAVIILNLLAPVIVIRIIFGIRLVY